MSRFVKFLAAFLGLIGAPALAQAQSADTTVGNLMEACNGYGNEAQEFCLAAVASVAQLMAANGKVLKMLPATEKKAIGWLEMTGICTGSEQVSGTRVVNIFKNWANSHRGNWSMDQTVGITKALSTEWPCKY